MKFICAAIILISISDRCHGDSDDFRQEAAKVVYYDPQYIKDIKLLTHRETRNSPYLTYANTTNLHPWENNITLMTDCHNVRTKHEVYSLEFKLCDVLKLSWARDWVRRYSNLPTHCPIPATTSTFNGVEVPPRNFPIALPPGDYALGLAFALTKTKRKILELKVNLRSKKKTFG